MFAPLQVSRGREIAREMSVRPLCTRRTASEERRRYRNWGSGISISSRSTRTKKKTQPSLRQSKKIQNSRRALGPVDGDHDGQVLRRLPHRRPRGGRGLRRGRLPGGHALFSLLKKKRRQARRGLRLLLRVRRRARLGGPRPRLQAPEGADGPCVEFQLPSQEQVPPLARRRKKKKSSHRSSALLPPLPRRPSPASAASLSHSELLSVDRVSRQGAAAGPWREGWRRSWSWVSKQHALDSGRRGPCQGAGGRGEGDGGRERR